LHYVDWGVNRVWGADGAEDIQVCCACLANLVYATDVGRIGEPVRSASALHVFDASPGASIPRLTPLLVRPLIVPVIGHFPDMEIITAFVIWLAYVASATVWPRKKHDRSTGAFTCRLAMV
jgi:hypothetical protein